MSNKLELTWHGKEQEISVEPRLLIEKPDMSNTDSQPDTENMLIHGDNLLELAPTLINKDEFDEYVINPTYSAEMLAAAVALHEGFTYQPDGETFWKQSHGSENSYLFVTTRHLSAAFLDSIATSMEDNEYLVIACCSFDKGLEKSNPHIAIKKIPQMLLEMMQSKSRPIIP